MRRLDLALLATLQLNGAQARSFSVHEDLLAFPQFDVQFSNEWILEKDAKSLINGDAEEVHTSALSHGHAQARGHENEDDDDTKKEYTRMKLATEDYLCTIPVVEAPSVENRTANELAKAEEAKELSRATASGWELLNDLEAGCLYFMSGWWTYKFCKNREIVQFHAAGATLPGQPPKRDPSTAEYILGSTPAIPMGSSHNQRRDPESEPLPAEVQTKGDQRYLVQRLEGGTVCDLTQRERTVEVQYHCVPGMKEARISWIKEVTICAYLMVVNTPKLCNDVAFLPPKETQANPIICQRIIGNDANPPTLEQNSHKQEGGIEVDVEVGEAGQIPLKGSGSESESSSERQIVGGVVVGARNVLSKGDEDGKPPIQLATNNYLPNSLATDGLVELVAHADSKKKGGKVKMMNANELENLDIDPQEIREMKKEVERIAGEAGWRIEVVDLPNDEREIRAILLDEEEGSQGDSKEGSKAKEGSKGGSEEGSQERLKDEL